MDPPAFPRIVNQALILCTTLDASDYNSES